jgi:hypothetical protein
MSLEVAHSKSIDAKAVCLFCIVTFGLGLSMALPLWLSGLGLRTPTARILLTLMMFAPAVGVLVVRLLCPKSVIPLIPTTGLGIGPRPRALGYWLFAWFGFTIIGLATPFVGELLRIPPSLAAAPRWRRSLSPIFSAKNGPHPIGSAPDCPRIKCHLLVWRRMGLAWILAAKALAVRPMASAPLDGSAVRSLVFAGHSTGIRLSFSSETRHCPDDHLLRHLRRPLWLAALGNRKYLAGSDWAWRAQRRRSNSLRGGGWELPYRYRARHYFGLDRLDFASARYPSPGHLKTPPGVRTQMMRRLRIESRRSYGSKGILSCSFSFVFPGSLRIKYHRRTIRRKFRPIRRPVRIIDDNVPSVTVLRRDSMRSVMLLARGSVHP